MKQAAKQKEKRWAIQHEHKSRVKHRLPNQAMSIAPSANASSVDLLDQLLRGGEHEVHEDRDDGVRAEVRRCRGTALPGWGEVGQERAGPEAGFLLRPVGGKEPYTHTHTQPTGPPPPPEGSSPKPTPTHPPSTQGVFQFFFEKACPEHGVPAAEEAVSTARTRPEETGCDGWTPGAGYLKNLYTLHACCGLARKLSPFDKRGDGEIRLRLPK